MVAFYKFLFSNEKILIFCFRILNTYTSLNKTLLLSIKKTSKLLELVVNPLYIIYKIKLNKTRSSSPEKSYNIKMTTKKQLPHFLSQLLINVHYKYSETNTRGHQYLFCINVTWFSPIKKPMSNTVLHNGFL